MVSAADSRGPGREQGSGEPVDEAGSPGRRSSGPKAPTRPWSIAAPERGAADETARASGAGSRGSRLSGRIVDVRESGYSDPKGVWGQLPSGSRESFAQGFEAEPAEATAPGESEGRGGHRTLERTEVAFPQKRGAEGRHDHSVCRPDGLLPVGHGGSHLRPGGEDAHSLKENLTRDHLSAMSGITLEGKLYMIEQERAFKGEDAVRFLKHLMGQIPGKVLVIWDGSPIHRGRAVKDFLASGASPRLQLEQLPFSTPRISTPTRGYGSTSSAWS